MKCLKCGSVDTDVVNSRPTAAGEKIWRRRVCPSCRFEMTTYEFPSASAVLVRKRSGEKVRYARHKYFASLYDALSSGKRADKGDAAISAEEVLRDIERRIVLSEKKELTTTELVDYALDALEPFDQSACYRYAAFSPHRGMKFGI